MAKITSQGTQTLPLPVPGKVVGNSLFIPLRSVGEGFGADVGWYPSSNTVTISSRPKMAATITGIVEGNIYDIEYNTSSGSTQMDRVRLIGTETPDPQVQEQLFGQASFDYVKDHFLNQKVYLEFDDEVRDLDGRFFAYAYCSDGTMINALLADGGYAYMDAIPKHSRWDDLFSFIQRDAMDARRGLWSYLQDEPQPTEPIPSVDDLTRFIFLNLHVDEGIVRVMSDNTSDADLSDWTLINPATGRTYRFPEGFVLKAGEMVDVVSGDAYRVAKEENKSEDGSAGFYFGRKMACGTAGNRWR